MKFYRLGFTKMNSEEPVHFSVVYIIGCIFMFLSVNFSIIAFLSPYWIRVDPLQFTKSQFNNIGLWQVCLHKYKHWHDNYKKVYSGCYWIFSYELENIRDWICPAWFSGVQAMITIGFLFTLFILIVVTISLFTHLRYNFIFQTVIAVGSIVSALLMLTSLIIFGINSGSREWMPKPDYNSFSWSYWFQMGSTFLCLISASCFFTESKTIAQLNNKTAANKEDEDDEYKEHFQPESLF